MAFDPGHKGEKGGSGCSSHVNNSMHTVKCSMCVKYGRVPACLHTDKQHALMGWKAAKPTMRFQIMSLSELMEV